MHYRYTDVSTVQVNHTTTTYFDDGVVYLSKFDPDTTSDLTALSRFFKYYRINSVTVRYTPYFNTIKPLEVYDKTEGTVNPVFTDSTQGDGIWSAPYKERSRFRASTPPTADEIASLSGVKHTTLTQKHTRKWIPAVRTALGYTANDTDVLASGVKYKQWISTAHPQINHYTGMVIINGPGNLPTPPETRLTYAYNYKKFTTVSVSFKGQINPNFVVQT